AAREQRARLEPLYREMGKVLVGQRLLIDRLLVGILTGGHLLLEGVPGLAKTLAVRTLARGLRLTFSRIQFTPDLLPADVIGTQIYNPRTGEFSIKKGPIFAQVVLADEINRAPAKEDELAILDRRAAVEPRLLVEPVLGQDDLFELRAGLDRVYMDDKIKRYIVDVVHATRRPAEYGLDIAPYIQYPASPRATIFLTRAAKGQAFLDGRGYVTPQDIKTIGYDVLRHRVIITYEAEAEDL